MEVEDSSANDIKYHSCFGRFHVIVGFVGSISQFDKIMLFKFSDACSFLHPSHCFNRRVPRGSPSVSDQRMWRPIRHSTGDFRRPGSVHRVPARACRLCGAQREFNCLKSVI